MIGTPSYYFTYCIFIIRITITIILIYAMHISIITMVLTITGMIIMQLL